MMRDVFERHKFSERRAVIRAESREPFFHAGRIERDAVAL